MAAPQGPGVGAETANLESGSFSESAVSVGDVSGIADTSLRLLRALEGDTDPERTVLTLREMLFKDNDPSTVAIFLHVVAASDSLRSSRVTEVMKTLGIEPSSLLEYLDPERLVELGLVDSSLARKRYQRLIGLETRTMTYDLNRDCPYGYAELAVLLIRTPALNDELWQKVLELVGLYTLEPFRVLCMVIDLAVVEGEGLSAESLEWLAKSEWRDHPDLPVVLDMFLDEPWGVQLASRLTVLGAISFTAMFAYIDPGHRGFTEYERQIKQEQEAATQSGMNALAMSELLDDDDEEDELMEDDRQVSIEAAESGTETRPSEETSDTDGGDKVHTALAYLGDIFTYTRPSDAKDAAEHALRYVNAYPLIAGSSDAIARGLSKYVCRLFASEPATRESVLALAAKYLVHVSHNLNEDVWSVMNAFAKANFHEAPNFWTDFFREYMLPSLDFEPAADSVLWLFGEQRRFELYNDLQTRVAKENFFVKNRFAKADKETKNILKRLTKSDAQEKIVPALLEVFGQCPLPSLTAFVNQVESYNIGSLVARSTSTHIPALAMDMLPLIIMQQLTASGRLAQQQDGLYESRWFRLLASFAGEIASQHADFNFLSLISLVLRQIGEGDFTQFIVLEQLLLRISGIPLKSNMSIPQVTALCSAPIVREMTQAALTEQLHPSRERLVESLQKHDMLLEVFVALCYVYNHMLLAGSNAKVVVNRRDLVAELIVVYAELIGGFSQFDVVELCRKYSVPLPFALTLWRMSTKELGDADLASLLPGSDQWTGELSADLYLNFWHMSTYDLVFDEKLYIAVGEMRDPKIVEKSSLSHKLRTKSMKQKLTSVKDTWFASPAGQWNAAAFVNFLLIPRIIVSPVDAIYASRFLQVLEEIQPNGFSFNEVGNELFSRGALLALLHTASPLQLESFALFTTDLFEYILRRDDTVSGAHRHWLSAITTTLLEVAVPTRSYVPLSNVFSFLQKTSFVFPMLSVDGEGILRRVHILTVTLSDGDLETSVKSLYAQLNKRKSLWVGAGELENMQDTEFYKAMVLNSERLELRLLASLRELSSRELSEVRPESEPKIAKRRGNSDRKDKRNGGRRLHDDLLSGIGSREARPDPRSAATKMFDDDRPQRIWGSRRDKARRRR